MAGEIGSLALSFFASIGMMAGLTPIGLIVAGIAVGISIAIGFYLNKADAEHSATSKLTDALRKSWEYITSVEPNSYKATYRPYGVNTSLHPASNYPTSRKS
ncbi:hypothetical protein R6242_09610 [Iodobacter sp. CM08]|uniref:hypothetical protein n=1 Tax=Iodobacter sp. CM08 TaxID=3085902 RepID=UPI00298266CF|nr:hypothetical protein [Iodobacter sp. CM08]MDW5416820.1 hypothetical protein [Iodobacter sp. CM08]